MDEPCAKKQVFQEEQISLPCVLGTRPQFLLLARLSRLACNEGQCGSPRDHECISKA